MSKEPDYEFHSSHSFLTHHGAHTARRPGKQGKPLVRLMHEPIRLRLCRSSRRINIVRPTTAHGRAQETISSSGCQRVSLTLARGPVSTDCV